MVSSLAGEYVGKMELDTINLEKYYSPYNHYSKSKLANILFTRALAKKLAGTNVTINSLHPGFVDTKLQRHSTVVAVTILSYYDCSS